MNKAAQGMVLIGVGVVLAVGTLALRMRAADEHDGEQRAREWTDSLLGSESTAQSFSDTPYIAGGIIAALVVLSGVIVYAGSSNGRGD